jgi:hypothetical protein
MGSILQRLWRFDQPLGVELVKVVYYTGLALIGFGAIWSFVASVFYALATPGLGAQATILVSLVAGAAAILLWRVACEVIMLAFQAHETLCEIRDRLPAQIR